MDSFDRLYSVIQHFMTTVFYHSFEYYIIPHPFSCLIELDSRLLVETL